MKTQTDEGSRTKHPGSKNGKIKNKGITKGDSHGDRKLRKEIRRHNDNHHQQNTRK